MSTKFTNNNDYRETTAQNVRYIYKVGTMFEVLGSQDEDFAEGSIVEFCGYQNFTSLGDYKSTLMIGNTELRLMEGQDDKFITHDKDYILSQDVDVIDTKFVVISDGDPDFPPGTIVKHTGAQYFESEEFDSLYMLSGVHLEPYDPPKLDTKSDTIFISRETYNLSELISSVVDINSDRFSVIRDIDGAVFIKNEDGELVESHNPRGTHLQFTVDNMDSEYTLVELVDVEEITLSEAVEYVTDTEDHTIYFHDRFTGKNVEVNMFTSLTIFGVATFNNLRHVKFYKKC